MPNFTRRDWIKVAGGLTPALALLGCESNDGAPQDAMIDAPVGTPTVEVCDNSAHAPHVVTVSPADVAAGVEKTYMTVPASGFPNNHSHMVTLTAQDFAMLQQGVGVMETSTVAICHMHVIVVNNELPQNPTPILKCK